MGKMLVRRIFVLSLLLAMVAWIGTQLRPNQTPNPVVASRPAGMLGLGDAPTSTQGDKVAQADAAFETGEALYRDTSRPLRDIPPAKPGTAGARAPENEPIYFSDPPLVVDPVIQTQQGLGPIAIPAPQISFEGISNRDRVYPPDTNGDVGPNHFVQMVNVSFQIWDKQGNSLYGPALNKTLWANFPAPCSTRNDGDPIVLYDPLADRWLLSQFVAIPPYGQCVAVSATSDPTGAYHRYFFSFSDTQFYDYPHIGVWPDGYYMGANRFTSELAGSSAIVFDREKMLRGEAAGFQQFKIASNFGFPYPSDLDGKMPPPSGAPNYFMARDVNSLNFWRFHVDWNNPANSSFTGPTALPTAPFNPLGIGPTIQQPDTLQKLYGIGDRLMHRLAYRNFGTHESLVVNHSVKGAADQAGVRWYEVRNLGAAAPTIYQQGTYAPDTTNRWMGSAASDRAGNIAMVYSASSTAVYPGIRYTARLVSDPLGVMTQGEGTLMSGNGSQTGSAGRWGDYASISVDPTDDCTFWMTTEYMPSTSPIDWRTRIGTFRLPNCVPPTPPNGCAVPYLDVPNTTFAPFIECLACRNIVSGYSDGTFRPNNSITRGQIAKIVAQSAGITDDPGAQIFEDVPPTNSFYQWINRLARRGVMAGYPCGQVSGELCLTPANRPYFRPNADATRGQLAKIVSEAAGYSDTPSRQTFQDVPPTSPFYIYIERLASRGVIGGYACGSAVGEGCVAPANRPYFRPSNGVTRGQASKIVSNTFFPGCGNSALASH